MLFFTLLWTELETKSMSSDKTEWENFGIEAWLLLLLLLYGLS